MRFEIYFQVSLVLFFNNFVAPDPICPEDKIPCDDGLSCIKRSHWCDDSSHCDDGSDEQFCKEAGFFLSDPNKCPESHFLCKSGPCIPKVAKCDGYKDCSDGSDEPASCILASSESSTVKITTPEDSDEDSSSSEEYDDEDNEDSDANIVNNNENKPGDDNDLKPTTPVTTTPDRGVLGVSMNEIELPSTYIRPAKKKLVLYTDVADKAVKWFLSKRRPSYGWGRDTPRALVALSLVRPSLFTGKGNKDAKLMKKQLQLQITLDILRNQTNRLSLNQLSQFINALQATCQDPTNFYTLNLVQLLRQQVSLFYATRRKDPFVNPFALITLCLAGESTVSDVHQIVNILRTQNTELRWQDMQAISILALSCLMQNYHFAKSYSSVYHQAIRKLWSRISPVDGSIGNIYSTALAVQTLMSSYFRDGLDLNPSLNFLVQQQKPDGSFGDILSTYYILPALTHQSLLQLKTVPCNISSKLPGLVPLEYLLDFQGPRHYIRYSLLYNDPVTVSYSILLNVPVNTSFFNIMRLAQHVDPKYRFSYEKKGHKFVVYSIGGVPNDAEGGMYWHLEAYLKNRELIHHHGHNRGLSEFVKYLRPYVHGVQQLIPKADDHIAFWLKPIRTEVIP